MVDYKHFPLPAELVRGSRRGRPSSIKGSSVPLPR